MKIGIVKHLNARPLTYFFEKEPGFEVFSENPSVLVEELKQGKLDCALISSIECERNSKTLDYSQSVGVCAKDLVRSVLYFQNKTEKTPPFEVRTDSGSRASVALLQCLFYLAHGRVPNVIPTKAVEISQMMEETKKSHLLFGDHALLHTAPPDYEIFDLATWWNQLTGKYFCFAFWAFPKGKQIQDAFFIEALKFGLNHLPEIIQNETRLPTAIVDRYLKKELHYFPEEKNLEGFREYIRICRTIGILD
ncbi:menaquinone biosynthetic enzyme MqnA/MqnD family protein [Leptospira idonii]|uniref:Chorismate dehydratase n=1 Tax=Leptospira idonii TaxID=1193500 RepID=A0A4R9LZ12_9LEPT|nr:MqnA/MqnD/SBP family protein [Leptospira idonii]TGN18617.1 menaquinone biosynthesis protein [Leptospira idonii]